MYRQALLLLQRALNLLNVCKAYDGVLGVADGALDTDLRSEGRGFVTQRLHVFVHLVLLFQASLLLFVVHLLILHDQLIELFATFGCHLEGPFLRIRLVGLFGGQLLSVWAHVHIEVSATIVR